LAKAYGDADGLASFEQYLAAFLKRQSNASAVHLQLEQHFCLGVNATAGRAKRLRPRLVMAAAMSLGASAQSVLAACTAIELLHNYSLIHDDIEDGDRLRHGRETLWSRFGLAHGVNAGDAVGALAQIALKPAASDFGSDTAFAMNVDLATANVKMCEGQAVDIELEGAASDQVNLPLYLEMIASKTAALFACAASLGARCAGADEHSRQRCSDIGQLYGLGFQISDDIAGCWGSRDETGKSPGGDIARRKKTFPIVWVMERGSPRAAAIVARAYDPAAGPLSGPAAQQVLKTLERAGARDAAELAAAEYFKEASARAQGLGPLALYVQERTKP